MTIMNEIKKDRIIAVLRNMNLNNAIEIATVLHENGINFIEITMEAEEGLKVINLLRSKMPESLVVGAGTVLTPETAEIAINAGAKFVFSPNLNIETIKMTKSHKVVCVQGALTPTEIFQAYENGADAVKVFPSGVFGPKYLKDLSGPYPQIPLIPTGGVNRDNLKDYFANGAIAIGVGTSLVDPSKSEEKGFYESLKSKTKDYVQQIKEIKAK